MRHLVLVLPWLWLTTTALALDPTQSLSTQAQRLWRSEDGLLQDTASALLESRDGFLWIGTGGGLVRFDGANFQSYSRINTPGFEHNKVRCLAEGQDGSLWIGTSEPGLYRLRRGELRILGQAEGLTDQPIGQVLCDREGTLWAAPVEGPLLRFNGTRFQAVPSGAANLAIRALAQDAEGTLWAGTARSGLWRLSEGRLVLAALTSVEITALAAGVGTEVIVGTRSQGPLVLTEGRLEPAPWAKGLPFKPIRALLLDREGSLWIGLEQAGLYRRTQEGRLEAAPSSQGSRRTPISLLEDRSGALWSGSEERGLQVLYPVPFQRLSMPGADPEEPARMVCQDSQGTVWCLSSDQALARIRQGQLERVELGLPTESLITSLWPRRAGGLWVGTRSGELYILDQAQCRRVHWPEAPLSDPILSLYEDPLDVLWAATAHKGLLKLAPGHAPVLFPALPGVQAMAGGGKGPLFMASRERGLGILESDQVRWLGQADGLGSNVALALHLDEEGSLWVGTVDGLRRYLNGAFQPLDDRSIPMHLAIHSVLEDRTRRLWLSTEQGVYTLPRAALLRGPDKAEPLPAILFDHHDGMPSRETSGGAQPAAWLTREGDFYFPTSRGLTRLDRPASTPHGSPLRLHIMRLEGDQTILADTHPVQVAPGTHRLEVFYTAPSLTRADKVRFRYRLEGWESTWNDAGDHRSAAYSSLPPGSYRFVLQAWRLDENSPPQECSIPIHIQPFLYQRPIFWALCLLGAAAFAWWLHRLRLQQLEARSAVLAERNRMAREIHDHLAQGFTGVLLQLEAAEAKLSRMEGDPTPILTRLDHARNLAVASLQEARRSVMALRPRKAEGTDLLGSMRLLTDRLLAGTDIQVELALVGEPRRLREQVEDELIRMAQEMLTNALRHGKAKWVRVVLQFEGQKVHLSVEDDGKGFDPSMDVAGYGMRSIRETVKQLRGQLDIDSSQGLGSRITITLPIRRWRP